MAKQKKAETDNPETNPKKTSFLLKILIFLLGTVISLSIILGAVVYFVGIPGLIPKIKAEAPPVYVTKDMGSQLVNLADESGGRYLKLNIVIEYKEDEALIAEIEEKNAELINGILAVLRSKRVSDVWPVDKENELKKEIANSINKELESGKVERILFTDFLIQ